MTTSRRLGIAALLLATVTMLAGCGSEDPDPSGDPPTGESPSESTDGSTVPADWQEVKIEVAQVHLPSDWTILDQDETSASFAAAKDEVGLSPGSGTMGIGVNSPSGDVKADIERATTSHLETYQGDSNMKNVKRLPDVTINDVLFTHVQWEVGQSWDSEYVTVTSDGEYVVTVGWGFSKSGIDRKGSQALIDTVMETFELL
ncbi:MAG: hypothetical protein ACRDS9_24370 [Pseudonocardiaceae bacterium]